MASIEKRGEHSYRLIVELGYDAAGNRIRKRKPIKVEQKLSPKKLQEHLEMELAKFKMEVEAGEYIDPGKTRFADFVEEWRKRHGEKNLAETTLETYNEHLKNHILPRFANMRLDQIKTKHIVDFMDDLGKPGARKDGRGEYLSPNTIVYIHRVLREIFKRAKKWDMIPKNPMINIEKPRVKKREMSYYDSDEAPKVIEALYKESENWRLYCLGALIGGFRRGELLALEWPDVDFENNTLNIDESISMTKNGQALIGEPKTESSIDEVDMPEWYMNELKAYYTKWKKDKLKVGDKWKGGDRQFVFHGGFGKPYYHTTPTTWWRRFIKRHGLKYIRLHDLRHTSATLLLEDGATMKEIQKRLRHAREQITSDIYAHVTPKLKKKTADKFEKYNPKNKSVPN